MNAQREKRAPAEAAADLVDHGITVGLGTGRIFDQSGPSIAMGMRTPAGGRRTGHREELEVLRLLATPRSRREIADRLYVSLNTVKTHQRVSIANSESPTGHGP
jgi:DNA-binding NarL/FixJ family response regulator